MGGCGGREVRRHRAAAVLTCSNGQLFGVNHLATLSKRSELRGRHHTNVKRPVHLYHFERGRLKTTRSGPEIVPDGEKQPRTANQMAEPALSRRISRTTRLAGFCWVCVAMGPAPSRSGQFVVEYVLRERMADSPDMLGSA